MSPNSIFFEFSLPNATTWTFFSFILALAFFVKFSRLLSMRNWDVLTLFLMVPGLLLLNEAHTISAAAQTQMEEARLAAARAESATDKLAVQADSQKKVEEAGRAAERAQTEMFYGYLWLVCGSIYFLFRCLWDLALVRRPALAPNLSLGGLAWLAIMLFVCLAAVAYRPPQPTGPAQESPVGKGSAAVDEVQKLVEGQLKAQGVDTEFWVKRSLALVCHLAIVLGLIFVGYWHFQDLHAGMAAATFYLLLPYTAMHVGQLHHVWPIAMVIWAIAAYRLPTVSGLLLGLAAGTLYFPALIFPVWLSFYWRRGAGRFTAAFVLSAGISLALMGFTLWLQGDLERELQSVLALSDWQPWKQPRTESLWIGLHWAYRIPVFVAYLAFLVTTFVWPAPKNLAHVLALSAALLIGIQFWYADQGGVFILWYLPLLLLMAFRPNLSDRRPPSIQPETDWLCRLGRFLARQAARLLKHPEPVARVH